jgi:hypothetical protein
MRVSEIQLVDAGDVCQLQAHVASDRDVADGDWVPPFTLWFRFPAWCRPFLRADNGDPFLAALLVPAMMSGERLVIPAPVSPRLLRSLGDIQEIYHSFDTRLHRIDVETTPRVLPEETIAPTASGLFFSLGVDSFYSLLKNQRDHPDDAETVRYLIMIHGFDVSHDDWDERFSPRMLASGMRVAEETGKTLLPVTTNLRPITRRLSRWNLSHGSALASIALALDGLFGQVLIAAGTTYDQLYPWGSHPVLDPRWSTERLTVVHDGCESGRIEKVRFLASTPLVLETLKVCPYYNCGRCIKCLPTIIDLLQAGVLDQCTTLPQAIDVVRLREVFRAYSGQLNVENYQRRLEGLSATEAPAGLREALTEFLAHEGTPDHPPQPQRSGRISALRDRLGRWGGRV